MSWWYQWFMPGADDHHRAAIGLFRIVGEFAGDGDRLLGRNAGDRLLPGRRIGHVVVIARRASAAEPAVEPVIGAQKIEDRGDDSLAVGKRRAAAPARCDEHVAALVVLGETLVRPAAEIGESDRHDLVAPIDQR